MTSSWGSLLLSSVLPADPAGQWRRCPSSRMPTRPFARGASTTAWPAASTPRSRSPNDSSTPASTPRSGPWALPTTMLWPSPRSGSTSPSWSGPRFASGAVGSANRQVGHSRHR